jgi:hypothetical protein
MHRHTPDALGYDSNWMPAIAQRARPFSFVRGPV